MKIHLVTPAPPGSLAGNRRTAERYALILRSLGHQVRIAQGWEGEPAEMLLALHARKSAAAVRAFRRAWPEKPIVVVLTGTDIYPKLGALAARTLALADVVVALQDEALRALPRGLREKTRVIVQSAERCPARCAPARDVFDVCVLGHLRAVKDPFRAALAARLLPNSSRVRIVHIGRALQPAEAARARREMRRNPRYVWLDELSHTQARRRLNGARIFVQSSRSEGGSSAMAEAIVDAVPILASRIPGAQGMLGRTHPGYFAVADTQALARLLTRAEDDPHFLARLASASRALAPRFAPERERAAWCELCADLSRR